MEVIRLASDSDIDIKTIPSEDTKGITPELAQVLNSVDGGKIYGGIFNDTSIKFIREGNDKVSFTPDYKDMINPNDNRGKNGGGDDGMSDLERRVQNLEVETQKIREHLGEIKYQNNAISLKLENTVTKADLLQFQNTVTSSQAQSFNQLPSVSEIKLIISEEMKKVPSSNDIKNILNDTINDKKLMTETAVENIIMKQRNSTIKWVIGTGIAITAAIAGVLKLFLH